MMIYEEIKTSKQYHDYCDRHLEIGKLLASGKKDTNLEREYYILSLIIDDYNDKQANPFDELTPVDLLKALMDEYNYSGYKLAKELNISQSIISEILHYKREFSKDLIRKLAKKFKVREQSFFKPYPLKNKLKQAS